MPNVKRRNNQKKRTHSKKQHNKQKQKKKARQPQKKNRNRNQDDALAHDTDDLRDRDRDGMLTSFLSEAFSEDLLHDFLSLRKARKNGTGTDPSALGKLMNFVDKMKNLGPHLPPARQRNKIQIDALWNVFPYSYRVGACRYHPCNNGEFEIILPPLSGMKNIDLQKAQNDESTQEFYSMLQDVSLWQLKRWYSLYLAYKPSSRFQLEEMMQFLNNAQFGDVLDIYPVLGHGTYIFGFGNTDFDTIANAYKTNTVDKHLKCMKTTNFDFMYEPDEDGYDVCNDDDCALIPFEFSDAPFQYFWNTALSVSKDTHIEKRLIDPLRISHKGVIWNQVMDKLADGALAPQFAEQHVALLDFDEYDWIAKNELVECKTQEIADSLQSYSDRYDAAVAQKRMVLFNFITHECQCATVLDQEIIQWIVDFCM